MFVLVNPCVIFSSSLLRPWLLELFGFHFSSHSSASRPAVSSASAHRRQARVVAVNGDGRKKVTSDKRNKKKRGMKVKEDQDEHEQGGLR